MAPASFLEFENSRGQTFASDGDKISGVPQKETWRLSDLLIRMQNSNLSSFFFFDYILLLLLLSLLFSWSGGTKERKSVKITDAFTQRRGVNGGCIFCERNRQRWLLLWRVSQNNKSSSLTVRRHHFSLNHVPMFSISFFFLGYWVGKTPGNNAILFKFLFLFIYFLSLRFLSLSFFPREETAFISRERKKQNSP